MKLIAAVIQPDCLEGVHQAWRSEGQGALRHDGQDGQASSERQPAH
jgi:hypothetical protein